MSKQKQKKGHIISDLDRIVRRKENQLIEQIKSQIQKDAENVEIDISSIWEIVPEVEDFPQALKGLSKQLEKLFPYLEYDISIEWEKDTKPVKIIIKDAEKYIAFAAKKPTARVRRMQKKQHLKDHIAEKKRNRKKTDLETEPHYWTMFLKDRGFSVRSFFRL